MNIDKKFLLVCLQSIIVLVMSMIVEGMMLNVDAPIIESSRHPLLQPSSNSCFNSTKTKDRNERIFRLYHQCSYKVVRVQDRVTTTTNRTDTNGVVVLESMMKRGQLIIRIRGCGSNNYVCYNRRGRLIAKPREKAKRAKCEFTEELMTTGDYSYRSTHNPDWFLGFNGKGQPLRGQLPTNRREDCFKFSKIPVGREEGFPDYLTRNRFDVAEHNRRIGHRLNDTVLDSINFNENSRLRHRKSRRRSQDRRIHFQRARASAADR